MTAYCEPKHSVIGSSSAPAAGLFSMMCDPNSRSNSPECQHARTVQPKLMPGKGAFNHAAQLIYALGFVERTSCRPKDYPHAAAENLDATAPAARPRR